MKTDDQIEMIVRATFIASLEEELLSHWPDTCQVHIVTAKVCNMIEDKDEDLYSEE